MVEIKKVKVKKIIDPYPLYCGDLIFNKERKCDLTILHYENFFKGYKAIFHDNDSVGYLTLEDIQKYCYFLI